MIDSNFIDADSKRDVRQHKYSSKPQRLFTFLVVFINVLQSIMIINDDVKLILIYKFSSIVRMNGVRKGTYKTLLITILIYWMCVIPSLLWIKNIKYFSLPCNIFIRNIQKYEVTIRIGRVTFVRPHHVTDGS